MKQISKEEAAKALIQMFSAVPFKEKNECSNFYIEKDGSVSFYIDKRNNERYEVIEKGKDYFADKNIVEGQCRIENMTLLWTVLHIEGRNNG